MLHRTIITILALTLSVNAAAQTLVAYGSSWNFLDEVTSEPAAAWNTIGFNDSAWETDTAPLGYGDTGVDGVTYTADKYATYFRRNFSVSNAGAVIALNVNIVDDDGSVIYINGVEVARNNMPGGAITYTTRASTGIGGSSETAVQSFSVDPTMLVDGTNVIAVQVHQVGSSSSDLRFDLELTTGDTPPPPPPPPGLARGPYLHVGTPTSIVVRWRTDSAQTSEVRYGTSSGNLNQIVNSSSTTTEHELQLSGLTPDTRYYYSIGTIGSQLVGPASGLSFKTSPAAGASSPVRIWTVGDAGSANGDQTAVYNAYKSYADSDYTNVFMMLGDNAYDTGTDSEYQAAVFDMYPEMLAASSLWSCRGNHEGIHSGFDYYDIFTFPKNAEAGGVASGTEAYYSFDVANVHFICLDSHGTDRSTSGAMYRWCEDDLQQNTLPWVVCFFHHPPYTKGSHDSDSTSDSGGRMRDMRVNFLPLLESNGVDLVLSGHSHCYERSYLIDGHYGTSSTFSSGTHGVDMGDGDPAGTGSYQKVTYGQAGNEGAVYIVAGSSGKLGGTAGGWPHKAMQYYAVKLGSLVIDVNDNVMDVRFLRETGAIDDYFQIVKGTTGSIRGILIGSGPGGPAWHIIDPPSAPNGTAEGDDTRFDGLDPAVDHILAPIGSGG